MINKAEIKSITFKILTLQGAVPDYITIYC